MSTLDYLIDRLIKERPELGDIEMPRSERERFRLYRSLVNIRPAMPADSAYLSAEEEYLKGLTKEKGITVIFNVFTDRDREIYEGLLFPMHNAQCTMHN